MRLRLIACALAIVAAQIGSVRADVLTYGIAGQYQGGKIAGEISIDTGANQVQSADLRDTLDDGKLEASFNTSSVSGFLSGSGLFLNGHPLFPPTFDIALTVPPTVPIVGYVLSLNLPYLREVGASTPLSSDLYYYLGTISISGAPPQPLLSQPLPVSGTATLVADVPEPSTWAMLLLGFGLVGGVTRLGRTQKLHFSGRCAADRL